MKEPEQTDPQQTELDDQELERVAGGTIAAEAGLKKLSTDPSLSETATAVEKTVGMDSETEIVEFQDGDDLVLRK